MCTLNGYTNSLFSLVNGSALLFKTNFIMTNKTEAPAPAQNVQQTTDEITSSLQPTTDVVLTHYKEKMSESVKDFFEIFELQRLAKFFHSASVYISDVNALKEVTEADPKAIIDILSECIGIFACIAEMAESYFNYSNYCSSQIEYESN
jgi:hypothetical protein